MHSCKCLRRFGVSGSFKFPSGNGYTDSAPKTLNPDPKNTTSTSTPDPQTPPPPTTKQEIPADRLAFAQREGIQRFPET